MSQKSSYVLNTHVTLQPPTPMSIVWGLCVVGGRKVAYNCELENNTYTNIILIIFDFSNFFTTSEKFGCAILFATN